MSYADGYTNEQLDGMLNRAQDKIEDQEDIIDALLAKNRLLQGRFDLVEVAGDKLEEVPLSEVDRQIRQSIRLLRQELNADGLSRPYGRLRLAVEQQPARQPAEPAKEARVLECEQRVLELGKQLHLAVLNLRFAEMDAYPECSIDWEDAKKDMYERGILSTLTEE